MPSGLAVVTGAAGVSRAGHALALSSRRRGDAAAPSFDEVELELTMTIACRSPTSAGLWTIAQGFSPSAERRAAATLFLDLEKSCYLYLPVWPRAAVADADVGRFAASDVLSASVMIGQNVTRQPEPAVELPAGLSELIRRGVDRSTAVW